VPAGQRGADGTVVARLQRSGGIAPRSFCRSNQFALKGGRHHVERPKQARQGSLIIQLRQVKWNERLGQQQHAAFGKQLGIGQIVFIVVRQRNE
jgi:hypothetical protein